MNSVDGSIIMPSVSNRESPDLGFDVPGYAVLSCIGAGGMGSVYRARHEELDREVALKVIRHDMEDDIDALKRFKREWRALTRLSHPNLIAIYDAGVADRHYYIAMELADAKSLHTLVKEKGRFSVDEARMVIVQLLDALDYLHG